MSDLRARLEASLSATYRLERELGSGGMAVVYLAHDLRHKRRVALKVLRPEISAVMGPERFLREIETVANLTHPHILPLHDSGEADGLLYYVMPYVEGESLRERMVREKQLPLDDALRIAREVADALGHAHGRGVIHRDIKPENILLSGGHALVADFGIAAAIDVAGGSRLTETGIAMGTPAYMSPEQALGERAIDARADIYALGCVLYEMLAGEPPFTGPTAQLVIKRRLHEPVPSVRKLRDHVPAAVDQTITKALAKVPADRFATAERFQDALAQSGFPRPVLKIAASMSRRRMRIALGVLALLALVIALAKIVQRQPRPSAALDDNLLLVFPFRVISDDSTLMMLRDGSVELLSTRIDATNALRAVDPAQTFAALRARPRDSAVGLVEASNLARQQGAGRVVTGSIVIALGRATVAVTVTNVATGQARTSDVVGPIDSLAVLMDQVATRTLVLGAGEREDRLQSLTTTSFPALKEYLAGVVAAPGEARQQHFREALRLDSTFALVALKFWNGAANLGNTGPRLEAEKLAFRFRHKLSERDRTFLIAHIGPRYPEESWTTERLQNLQRALSMFPESSELWQEYADWLFHRGGVIGMDNPFDAFQTALARADTTEFFDWGHRIQIAARLGDTVTLTQLVDRAIAENITPPSHTFYRWLRATVTGDERALDSIRATFPNAHNSSLLWVVYFGEEQGVGVADARRAVQLLLSRATANERRDRLETFVRFAANQGRLAEAARAAQTGNPIFAANQRVLGALYWNMDTVGIGPLISRLLTRATHPDTAEASRVASLCTLELWRIHHGDFRSAESTVQQLRRARSGARIQRELCPLMIEALVEARDQRSTRALEALDSLVRLGPEPGPRRQEANLILARLHDRRGDPRRALAAVRRRGNMGTEGNYLSTFLREEGRLAAMLGDTAGAIKAYRHYLALRYDPEPAVRNEVEGVRAELRRLSPDRSLPR